MQIINFLYLPNIYLPFNSSYTATIKIAALRIEAANTYFLARAVKLVNKAIKLKLPHRADYKKSTYNWRVREASETQSGVYKVELVRYIYILIT